MQKIEELTGKALEERGYRLFCQMGLNCVYPLKHVSLQDLDPNGPFTSDENMEMDYLIVYGEMCIIGEITSRGKADRLRDKYKRFRTHFNVLSKLNLCDDLWMKLGVPEHNLRDFGNVSHICGFFMSTRLEKYDVNLQEVANIVRFYRYDWTLLNEYAECIGSYAKLPFLQAFGSKISNREDILGIDQKDHRMISSRSKIIASSGVGVANVFTFEVSPYKLLPRAQVYRRDDMPSLATSSTGTGHGNYQRALRADKIKKMREKLLTGPDFMFPNSILVVLSNDCECEDERLLIPNTHGAMSVIDGQHRLFSYADEKVRKNVTDDCKIMVTAIQFIGATSEQVSKYSARIFIEINMTQTPIKNEHYHSIAYEILGEKHSAALAAQVILRANARTDKVLHGIFDTNQTGLGIIQATTVMSSLKLITKFDDIKKLNVSTKGKRFTRRTGYEILMNCDISTLSDPEKFIDLTVICLERFFSYVKRSFPRDWPERGETKNSSLEYAKVIASFVKLLNLFISQGSNWNKIEEDLQSLRTNLVTLRKSTEETIGVVFDPAHPDIPDATQSVDSNFRFLAENIQNPVSMLDIIARKERRISQKRQ